MKRVWVVVVLLGCIAVWAATPPERMPVPDAAALEPGRRLVRETYKQEIAAARTADQKSVLAGKMVAAANATTENPAARYELYKLAQQVAFEARDDQTALGAADALARSFEVDEIRVKSDLIAQLAKAPHLRRGHIPMINEALELAERAVSAERYADAKKLGAAAVLGARLVGDVEFARHVEARVREINDAQAAAQRAEKAVATLKTNPTDAAASRTRGRFLCFNKGDWLHGLRLLARGDDAGLAAVAKKELAVPATAAERLALADTWWELGDKNGGRDGKMMHVHARSWYALVASGLDGLSKARVEQRIAQADAEASGDVPVPMASIVFEEHMGYTIVELVEGVSTHNNAKSAVTRVPAALRGKPFTQVVSDHPGPVKFRFLTGGRMYIVAPQHGSSPPLDDVLPRVAQREDMTVESPGHHWEVWSVTSDAGGVVELPDQAALVAASLKKAGR